MTNIVVGIDRSGTARTAAEKAAGFASALDATLHIVMTIERKGPTEFSVGSDRFRVDPMAESEQFLADVARSLPHDKITTAVLYGDPAKMICDEAKRCDAAAIVVGNRRTKGMSRVMGSVAGDIVKMAPCDVLIANTTH